MNQFIRSFATLLISGCLAQVVWAQFNIIGPGFQPDENGTNPDAPRSEKTSSNFDTGASIKHCSQCPDMVLIPAGIFFMGSEENQNERPKHSVSISSFYMGRTEITQGQWTSIMGYNTSRADTCEDCPVENVSWSDIELFIRKLNQKTGQRYRLPSEAEWEYAARAGTTTAWSHGTDKSNLGDYAWYERNSGGKPQKVGQKLPNLFGLYDMYGNVAEWVADCFHLNYVGAPTDGRAWTTNCNSPQSYGYGTVRGGSWVSSAERLRSAYRGGAGPSQQYGYDGFRLARDL